MMELQVRQYRTKRGALGIEITTSYYNRKLEKSHIRSIWVPLGLIPALKAGIDRESRRLELQTPISGP
jgi:hypothetical protein